MKLSRALAVGAVLSVSCLAVAPVASAEDTGKDVSNSFTRHARAHTAPEAARSAASAQGAAATTDRIFGADRVATAIEASKAAWSDAGGAFPAEAVVLSRQDEYADALGGSALAGAAAAPLLLTPPTSLRSDVEAEIGRVLGSSGTVYVLGGTGAVSTAVTDRLTTLGYTVVRLSGADRYSTSVEIAKRVASLAPGAQPQFVFATTGQNFPDGLAAGATAGGYWASVVLTRDNEVPASVKSYIDELQAAQVPVFAVGGATAQAPVTWDDTFVGADRFETAAEVAGWFWGDPTNDADNAVGIGLATGLDWPDALSGGAHMAALGPLVLSRTDSLPSATQIAIDAVVNSADPASVQFGTVFGGPAVVSDAVLNQFAAQLP